MSEDRFEIVFRGDIVVGHQLDDVKARVARLFKIDVAKVDKLFSGAAVSLKSGLDKDQAQQYKDTLKKAGLLVDSKKLKTGGDKAPTATTPTIRIAPVGASLNPQKQQAGNLVEVDISHLDVCPQEGYLLDESEREALASVSDIDPDWDIAAIGADLVAASDQLPDVPTIEPPDFDLAPVGEALLDPDESRNPEPDVEVPNIDVLPVGENLTESIIDNAPKEDIDISHLTLKPRPAEFKLD